MYSYTREAYLDLVNNIKRIIPGRLQKSDLICSFNLQGRKEY